MYKLHTDFAQESVISQGKKGHDNSSAVVLGHFLMRMGPFYSARQGCLSEFKEALLSVAGHASRPDIGVPGAFLAPPPPTPSLEIRMIIYFPEPTP